MGILEDMEIRVHHIPVEEVEEQERLDLMEVLQQEI
jgi:hypothetical protein